MRLSELARAAGLAPAAADPDISAITADSREAGPGVLFAALAGTRADGARFVPAAIAAGAAAVLAAEDAGIEAPDGFAIVRSPDPRQGLARLAAAFFGRQPEVVVAVTGTNGKSSVASFTEQIWRRQGLAAGSIGTLGVSGLDGADEVSLTSPDPVTLHRVLAKFAAAGVQHVAIEASSHGLAQKRLDGVRLRAGAFTNFTRDHLDYHETFEAYFEAKLRLFTALLGAGAGAVVNLGGEMGGQIADAAHKAGLGVMTVGRGGAELGLIAVRPEDDHLAVEVALETGRRELAIPLFGTFQAENALVAAGLAAAGGGVSLDDAVTALEHLEGARGRLELVGATRAGAKVFVDYAHTPGALAVVLAALRAHTRRRLIVVFGAGGDRDAGKRVLMGRAAAAGADEVIVTDDNPRHEDAGAIRKAVLEGVPAAREIGGRRDAIAEGVCRLGDGDVLLVAGKGHESGQIVGDEVLPFSDHHEIRRALGGSEAA